MCIYDSGRMAMVSLEVKKQIDSFVMPQSNLYTFDVMNIQGQPNGSDCGLFAIALSLWRDGIQCCVSGTVNR